MKFPKGFSSPPEVNNLFHAFLTQTLEYTEADGKFKWRAGIHRDNRCSGKEAGSIDSKGYVAIRLLNERFAAHILAWFYVTKSWPNGDIDHIDGDRTNNCIENLRDTSRRGNLQNRAAKNVNNTTGYVGITRHYGKFRAYVYVDRKRICLGCFARLEDAVSARKSGVEKYFTEKPDMYVRGK